jgi:UPF0755 protein
VELLVIVDKPALLRVGAALLASVLIIAGLSLIKRGPAAAADFPCQVSSSAEKISIDVSSGETGSEIALELFDKGVTKSQESFFRIAVADQRSSSIAPGIHLIDREICAKDALTQLLDNKRIAGLINVKVSEIKVAFTEAGYSQKEIDRAFAQATIPQPFSRVEGLLFPAQYSFAKGTPIERAIVEMISRGEQEVMRAGFADKTSRFTEQELLIIASIIQAEGTDDNFGQVSRVIYNRLKIGMPLQMDSTVHYVQAQRGDIFLSTKSTLLKSPFNTYRNAGLPPGPIGNPGRNAMLAAVTPTPGDWLYFITVAPGDTRFTKSFDEFNEWKLIYKANLRAGKFEDK